MVFRPFAPIALLAILSGCSSSNAYPRHPHKAVYRERAYARIVVSGKPYFYHAGHFYWKRPHHRYVLVEAPMGGVVYAVPGAAVRLRYGPTAFYYYEGIYYRPAPGGYVVVSKPDTVYVDRPEASSGNQEAPAENVAFREPEATTVMVANSNGSKTPVRLESMDGGKWKGPQGEIYDAMPTEDQLRSAYGF
jgi:hypothetical protein